MRVTTSLNVAYKWLMHDSGANLSVFKTRIGITLYRVTKNFNVSHYIKWQDTNRQTIECLFDGYLMAGNRDMNFEDFSRKLYNSKIENKA